MSSPIIRYPLDLTGHLASNHVTGEPHAVSANGNRAFVPEYGPFYADSLRVYRASTGQLLTRGTHYKPAQLFVDATLKVGQEINSIVVITDPTIGNDFFIDYQVLGGDYSTSVFAIQQMLNSLSIDNRPIDYGELIGKPEQFPPAPHLHDVGDTYGWEYIVAQLEAVRRAILYGDDQSHNAIYQYIDHAIGQFDARLDGVQLSLTNHIQDFNNPHQTTKSQVGLGNVENYLVATQLEAEAGARNDRYMTPLRTAQAINQLAGNLLANHILDHTNPHQTTKSQVGLGNVDNYATATLAEAVEGMRNDLFVTPLGASMIANSSVGASLQAHVTDFNNPHVVTKAQVGLGNVANYAPATNVEAAAGVANNLYITPATLSYAIQNGASNALNAHLTNFNNPHNTTKAQVGLGNVENYPPATVPDAEAGTRSDMYMTPLTNKAAITAQVGNALTAHITNNQNPHSVTKAQVGLGNVANYPVANEAEARTGTAPDRYMTPLRTRQAIDQFAMPKPQAFVDHWGYWRDPSTGITHCWGRTPPLAPGQYFYCHFKRWFTHVFSMVEGGWTRNIDTGIPSNLPNALGEVRARPLHRTISNRGFAVVAMRDTGSNTDYLVYNWYVVGVSDESGLGGPNAGQFISPVSWVDNGSTDGYDSGGVSNYIDTGLLGGNQTPIANYSYTFADLTTNYTSTSTDSDGTIASYSWNFGDGATSTLANPSHTYGAYGNYQVSLTVTDNNGAGSTKTTTVSVIDPNAGGGGCIATTMYIDLHRLASSIQIDDWVDGSDAPNMAIVRRQVRDNRVMTQPCYLMTTVSGIQIIASDSTPMELRDGSMKMLPAMEGELVLVDDDGDIRWEAVESLEYVGMRSVVLFNVDNQSFFAGINGRRRIATHNMAGQKN